jgi:hypothetical protein
MRSLKALWRIAVAVCATLTVASLDDFVFDSRSFVSGLIEGVAIFGSLLLLRYLDSRKQRRPLITAEQQLPKAGERDASGG